MSEQLPLFSLFSDHEDLCNCILSYLDILSIYNLELSNRFFHEQLQQVNTDRCVYGSAVFKLARTFCDDFIIEKQYFDGFKWGSGKTLKFRKVLEEFYNNTFSRIGFKSDTLIRVNNQLVQSHRESKFIEIVKWMPCLLLYNLFRVAYNDVGEKFKRAIFLYLIDYSKANWKTSHRDLRRVSIRKKSHIYGYRESVKNSPYLASMSDGNFLLTYLEDFKSLKSKYDIENVTYHRSSFMESNENENLKQVEDFISLEVSQFTFWGSVSTTPVTKTISQTTIVGGVSKKTESINLEQEISELYLELFGLATPQVYETKKGRIAYDEKNNIFVVFPFVCDRLSATDKNSIH